MQSVWNGFFGRKKFKSHRILRGKKQSQKSPYLDHEFMEVTKTKWDLKTFLSGWSPTQFTPLLFFLCESVPNFSLCWVSTMSQIDEGHLLLLETTLDVDGGCYFITSTSIPFVIFTIDYATMGIIPLSMSTMNPNSFRLFCCRM